MQYFGYLRRDPDAGPTATSQATISWLNKLNTFNVTSCRPKWSKLSSLRKSIGEGLGSKTSCIGEPAMIYHASKTPIDRLHGLTLV